MSSKAFHWIETEKSVSCCSLILFSLCLFWFMYCCQVLILQIHYYIMLTLSQILLFVLYLKTWLCWLITPMPLQINLIVPLAIFHFAICNLGALCYNKNTPNLNSDSKIRYTGRRCHFHSVLSDKWKNLIFQRIRWTKARECNVNKTKNIVYFFKGRVTSWLTHISV